MHLSDISGSHSDISEYLNFFGMLRPCRLVDRHRLGTDLGLLNPANEGIKFLRNYLPGNIALHGRSLE